jgi:hypothetical protein
MLGLVFGMQVEVGVTGGKALRPYQRLQVLKMRLAETIEFQFDLRSNVMPCLIISMTLIKMNQPPGVEVILFA